jgi:toxin-antitoxin system, toxin component, bro family
MELIKVSVENVNGVLVTTSNRVAQELGVNHKDLLEKIEGYIEKFTKAESSALGENLDFTEFYIPSSYKVEGNFKSYKNYLITEKGIAQLIGGYNASVPKAFLLNVSYINEFERMKNIIKDNIQKPLTIEDMIILQAKEMKNVKHRIDVVENKVDNEITLDSGEQRKLQRAISVRVYQRLDVINAERKLMFPAIHRDVKDRFGVASYRDIKRKDLKEALLYVQNWIEKAELREAN